MRVLILSLLILAGLSGLVLLAGCQRWSPNNPPRMGDNPEIQAIRDARRNGHRQRCAECHTVSTEPLSGPIEVR